MHRMVDNLSEKYYHGFLTKRDIEPLLTVEGDFLVRKTDWRGVPFFKLFWVGLKRMSNQFLLF